MRVCLDKPVTVGWKPCKKDFPQLQLAVFAKIVCQLKPGVLEPLPKKEYTVTGDLFFDDDAAKGLRYDSDFALFKPRADITLVGSAHAPGGRPVPELQARFRVGPVNKVIDVIGDRVWEGNVWYAVSKPQPFTSMPLRYEYAFGGANSRKNPAGKGFGQNLPNLELPKQRIKAISDRPDPACFAPISAAWPSRAALIGTYGERYKERWPWLPADFDWAHFNAAPPDQQVPGYLKGDEEVELVHLHRTHSYLHTRLPGLRVRWFINRREPSGGMRFHEVPLVLDTVWFDTDADQVALVWRGLTPIQTIRIKELEQMLVVAERMADAPGPLPHFEKVLAKRVVEGDEEFADKLREAKEKADAAKAEAEKYEKQAREEAEKARVQLEQRKAELAAKGAEPAASASAPPALPELCDLMAKQIADAKEKGVPADDPHLVRAEAQLAELRKLSGEMPDMAPLTRDAVIAAVRAKQSLAKTNLVDLDLSGVDLSGADLTKAFMLGANLTGCRLLAANLSGTVLKGANLANADLSGATLDNAILYQANLSGAKLVKASLRTAILAEANLRGADLKSACAEQAIMYKADLTGVDFREAKVARANLGSTTLEGAKFNGSDLTGCHISAAKAARVDMEGADVTAMQSLLKTDYTEANFRLVRGKKSVWLDCVLDRANFSRAGLEEALFMDSMLTEANLDRAVAVKADFSDAVLRKAALTNANLMQCIFDRADLSDATLRGSNLYESSFWEAKMDALQTRDANLKRSSLA